jgi:hypothetical protein
MKNRRAVYVMIATAFVALLIPLASAAEMLVYASSLQDAVKSVAAKQSTSKTKYKDSKGTCYKGWCPSEMGKSRGPRCFYRHVNNWWAKYTCTGGTPNCIVRHVWNEVRSSIGC